MPHTKELVTRNSTIINDTLQKKILTTKLGFIGCGLGSNIAELAARTGFVNFLLADGDKVDDSNLNRQEYSSVDIGHNKATRLSERLLSINSDVIIDRREHNIIHSDEIDEIAKWADVIINTADFSNGFYKVNRAISKCSKISIVPFNVGYGSVVTVFGRQNIDLTSNSFTKESSDGDHFIKLLKISQKFELPKYFLPVFKQMINKEKKISFIPQIGIAANISSANVLTIVIKYLLGESIPYFPNVSHIDLKNV